MKKFVWLILLASASLVSGQQQGALYRPGDVTKVVTLQYPDRVNTSILDGIGLTVKRADNLVVITGPQARVDTAADILKQLDTPAPPRPPIPPKKSIQLTAYLVIASSGNPTPAGSQPTTPVPKELDPAVSQVASMFSYKSFNLLDAIIMRSMDDGSGFVDGLLPGGSYEMIARRVNLAATSPDNLFHLQQFELSFKRYNGVDRDGKDKYQTVSMRTDVDLKEGQKAVVGKANFDGASDALIVILTAKVVE